MAEKKCTKCGITKPLDQFHKQAGCKLGRRPDCMSCHAVQSKEYRLRCLDKLREAKKIYRLKNAERIKEKDRKYYAQNKHRWIIQEKKKKNDPIARKRQYAIINRWRKKNKDQVNVWTRNRRALIKRLEGTHTKQDILDLFAEQRGLCAHCSCDITLGYHVDHIIPVSKMGRNDKENLQLLCRTCNLTKNNKVTEKEEKNGRYSSVPSQLERHRSQQ